MNQLKSILWNNVRLLVVLVVFIAIGGTAFGYHMVSNRSSKNPTSNNTPVTITDSNNDATNGAEQVPAKSTTQTQSVATNPQASTPVRAPAQPDNSARCSAILAEGEGALKSLDNQIVEQLQIMKTIIGNNSIDSRILSYGGSVSQTVGQGAITESFNQANDNVNSLINQSSTTRDNYVGQLETLQCWAQAGAMLNYNPAS